MLDVDANIVDEDDDTNGGPDVDRSSEGRDGNDVVVVTDADVDDGCWEMEAAAAATAARANDAAAAAASRANWASADIVVTTGGAAIDDFG
jgi:hypothetical protein